jgi:hypothetical protein
MDATRRRRLQDTFRQGWYARWRCTRFARRFGFPAPLVAPRAKQASVARQHP